jgi:hypothetical protein
MTVERTCCRHCPALMRYLSRISRRVQSGRPGPTWVAFDGFTSPLFSNDQDRTQQAVGIERLGENPSSDLLMDGGGRRRRSSCRCAWRLQAVGRPGRDTCRARRSPTTAGSVAGSAVGADDVTSPEVGAGRCRLAAAPGERGGWKPSGRCAPHDRRWRARGGPGFVRAGAARSSSRCCRRRQSIAVIYSTTLLSRQRSKYKEGTKLMTGN